MITKQRIPILDLSPEITQHWEELNQAIQQVLLSGEFIMGTEVKVLERELADYLGSKHAIALNSGTDALVLALRALDIGPGDEVITTPFTFFATAEAISTVGATPVFVDVDAANFNIDPAQIEAAINPKTKAIMPVHLYGNPAPMHAIMQLAQKHDLKIIEDCAQSFGARYYGGSYNDRASGTIGDMGAYSFFPSKNLGAFGDGGLLTTDDDHLADLARMLRAHGSRKKYHNEAIGYNSRLDTLQAAILRVKLPHIDEYNAARRAVAQRYNDLLKEVGGLVTPVVYDGHVFHQYTLRILDGKRDRVQQKLADNGIDTMIYYPLPVHKLPVYRHLELTFPVSEQLAQETLSLPIWPQISPETQKIVVEALKKALV